MFLNKTTHAVENGINGLSRVVHRIGGFILAAMMFLTAADVFLRYIFNRPISGAIELNENMLVMLVFFSIAYTAVQKGHVRVELLVARLPMKAQIIIDSLSGILALSLSILITWQSVALALEKVEQGLTTAVLFVPVYPFIFMAAFGAGLLSLVLLTDLIRSLRRVVQMPWKTSDWLVTFIICIVLGAAIFYGVGAVSSKLSPAQTGYAGFILLIVLLFAGIPIGFVMAMIGFAGMA